MGPVTSFTQTVTVVTADTVPGARLGSLQALYKLVLQKALRGWMPEHPRFTDEETGDTERSRHLPRVTQPLNGRVGILPAPLPPPPTMVWLPRPRFSAVNPAASCLRGPRRASPRSRKRPSTPHPYSLTPVCPGIQLGPSLSDWRLRLGSAGHRTSLPLSLFTQCCVFINITEEAAPASSRRRRMCLRAES